MGREVNYDLPVDVNGRADCETYLHRIGRHCFVHKEFFRPGEVTSCARAVAKWRKERSMSSGNLPAGLRDSGLKLPKICKG